MSRQISRTISAQASVLLVYSICLFLIGLTQVSLGVALRLVYAINLHIYCYPDWAGCLVGTQNYFFFVGSQCCFFLNFLFSFIDFTAVLTRYPLFYIQRQMLGKYIDLSVSERYVLIPFISSNLDNFVEYCVIALISWRNCLYWRFTSGNTFIRSGSIQNKRI